MCFSFPPNFEHDASHNARTGRLWLHTIGRGVQIPAKQEMYVEISVPLIPPTYLALVSTLTVGMEYPWTSV